MAALVWRQRTATTRWCGAACGWEPNPQRGRDNQPAVMVTWVEAMAYCRLASAAARLRGAPAHRMGVAAGGDRRASGPRIPLGARMGRRPGEHLRERVGPGHGGRALSARGIREGVLDLAGNVWDWCLNKYDKPEDKTEGGDDRRVLRGGSWCILRGLARCASRLEGDPGNRSSSHRLSAGVFLPHPLNTCH